MLDRLFEPRVGFTPEEIDAMTPEERHLEQDRIIWRVARARGWKLHATEITAWPGRRVELTDKDFRSQQQDARCHVCRRRYRLGEFVQRVLPGPPRRLVCVGCMDRYLKALKQAEDAKPRPRRRQLRWQFRIR